MTEDSTALADHDGQFLCSSCDTIHDFDGGPTIVCPTCLLGTLGKELLPLDQDAIDAATTEL